MKTAASYQHSMSNMRAAGDEDLADFLEQGRMSGTGEEVALFRQNHPEAPSDDQYDYHRMFEENKISNEAPEDAGELNFLPAEGYTDSKFRYWMEYDQNSKTRQFTSAVDRVLVHGAKEAWGTLHNLAFGDLAVPFAQLMEGKEKVSTQKVNAMRERIAEYRFPPSIHNLKMNEANTMGAIVEQLGGEIAEIAADIGIARGVGAGARIKQGAGFLRKFVSRLEVATQSQYVAGEFLYASNPANEGTASSLLLADHLENDWGMQGPVVDFLRETDDDPLRQGLTAVIEGMLLFEGFRTAARLGIRIPKGMWDTTATFISRRIAKPEQVKAGAS